MKETKICIAGSREFLDYEWMRAELFIFLSKLNIPLEDIEVVSGLAKGADMLGKELAMREKLKCHDFPANWARHQRAAGFIRNQEMCNFSDAFLIFWDGESRGTEHMLKLIEKKDGSQLHLVKFSRKELLQRKLNSLMTNTPYIYARTAEDRFEVSSKGDKRFSPLYARLADKRSIEEAYQLDVKGWRSDYCNWMDAKGKPPKMKISKEDLWQAYKDLWVLYFKQNPWLLVEVAEKAKGKTLTDMFGHGDITQARAICEILNALLYVHKEA